MISDTSSNSGQLNEEEAATYSSILAVRIPFLWLSSRNFFRAAKSIARVIFCCSDQNFKEVKVFQGWANEFRGDASCPAPLWRKTTCLTEKLLGN